MCQVLVNGLETDVSVSNFTNGAFTLADSELRKLHWLSVGSDRCNSLHPHPENTPEERTTHSFSKAAYNFESLDILNSTFLCPSFPDFNLGNETSSYHTGSLQTTYVVRGQIMFSQMFVCPQGGGGAVMVGPWAT